MAKTSKKTSKKAKSSKTKCPKGQIKRVSYTRKDGTKVKSTCVPDKGKPGKGPKIFTIPKEDAGLLGDYGYTLKNKHEDRIKSIKKALKENPKLKILRYLNALRTLQKSNEKYYKKLDKDVKWLQKEYENL